MEILWERCEGPEKSITGSTKHSVWQNYAYDSDKLGPYPSNPEIPRLIKIYFKNFLITDFYKPVSVQKPLILTTSWWSKYNQYFDFTSKKKKKYREVKYVSWNCTTKKQPTNS